LDTTRGVSPPGRSILAWLAGAQSTRPATWT